MQNESNSYTMFAWYTGMNSSRYDSHCYEILGYNQLTNTEKQEGTGVNLYHNEKHKMMQTPPQTKVEQL